MFGVNITLDRSILEARTTPEEGCDIAVDIMNEYCWKSWESGANAKRYQQKKSFGPKGGDE